MEPKHSYMLVGLFVVAAIASAFVFVLWMAGTSDRNYQTYAIYFEESVNGLSVGGTVSYRGLQVGKVKSIVLDPQNPQRLKVVATIDDATPIRQDTEAMLKFQGVTGVAFIELRGGNNNSPPLTLQPGEDYLVIRSIPSSLEKVFSSVPEMAANLSQMAQRGNRLLGDDNLANFGDTLKHIESVTATLEKHQQNIDEIITETHRAMKDIASVSHALAEDQNMTAVIREMRNASEHFASLAKNMDRIVSTNEQALNQFSGEGLNAFTALLQETRDTNREIKGLAKRLNDNPSGLLLSAPRQGYKVNP